MASIILYSSRYGTTEAYAKQLAALTGFHVCSCQEAGDLFAYDRVIHMGGLYAGRVNGLKKTLKSISGDSRLVVITVGMESGSTPEGRLHLQKTVRRQLPEDRKVSTVLFHLRGRINYSRLSPLHRAMMAMLIRSLRSKPEDQRQGDHQMMIDSYGKDLNLMDLSALAPIAEALK